jgi:hypothetical protein
VQPLESGLLLSGPSNQGYHDVWPLESGLPWRGPSNQGYRCGPSNQGYHGAAPRIRVTVVWPLESGLPRRGPSNQGYRSCTLSFSCNRLPGCSVWQLVVVPLQRNATARRCTRYTGGGWWAKQNLMVEGEVGSETSVASLGDLEGKAHGLSG